MKLSCKKRAHVYCLLKNKRDPTFGTYDQLCSQADFFLGCGWQFDLYLQDYTHDKAYSRAMDSHYQITPRGYFIWKYPKIITNHKVKEKESNFCFGKRHHSRVNFPKRGGKVSLRCEDHRQAPKICNCSLDSEARQKKKIVIITCNSCKRPFHK
jgi:hypothetical protein